MPAEVLLVVTSKQIDFLGLLHTVGPLQVEHSLMFFACSSGYCVVSRQARLGYHVHQSPKKDSALWWDRFNLKVAKLAASVILVCRLR